MKHNGALYIPCNDPDICSRLKQGDTIFYRKLITSAKERKGFPEYKWVRYTLTYNPRFFSFSENWSLRVHTGCLKKETGQNVFQEYAYVNREVMHKYLFHSHLVHQVNKENDEAALVNAIIFSK